MKAIKRILAASVLAFGACSGASAEVISQTYTPLVLNINSYAPVTYVHDLRNFGLTGAVINSATLALYLYDGTDLFGARGETVTLNFDGGPNHIESNVSLVGRTYSYNLATSLLSDGLLEVSIRVGCDARFLGACISPQDVTLARSQLSLDITRPGGEGEVPEPATLLTLAAGLLGLGAARRRKRLG